MSGYLNPGEKTGVSTCITWRIQQKQVIGHQHVSVYSTFMPGNDIATKVVVIFFLSSSGRVLSADARIIEGYPNLAGLLFCTPGNVSPNSNSWCLTGRLGPNPTSDHGETIYADERELFRHIMATPSRYGNAVPFFIWANDQFKAN